MDNTENEEVNRMSGGLSIGSGKSHKHDDDHTEQQFDNTRYIEDQEPSFFQDLQRQHNNEGEENNNDDSQMY